ncbi:MAG TPA: protein kinase, partial [Acetobacteraceae bacterium]
DKQERFAIGDTMRIMTDLLNGLQFSHARGVVHRDIKPANLMLTSGGQAKIADFGIARIESSSLTQVGTVMGTPAYMSPEQFMGQVVNERTDIYSAAVVLYQLLTGERPFDGSTTSIMHKVLNTEPPLPSQLANTAPPAIDAVVRRAMAKRPEERFPSAAAFEEAISTAVAAPVAPAAPETELTMLAVPPAAPPPERPAIVPNRAVESEPSRRRGLPILALIAGVVLVAVLGAGTWWFVLRPTPATQVASASPATAPSQVPLAAPAAPAVVATPVPQAALPGPASTPSSPRPATPPPGQATSSPPPPAASTPAIADKSQVAPNGAAGQAPASETATSPLRQHPTASMQAPPTQPVPAVPPATATPVSIPALPAGTATVAPAPPLAAPPPAPPAETAPAAHPPSEQVAAVDLAPVRRQIEQALLSSRCAFATGIVQDSGTITVTGIAGRSADDALRQRIDDIAISRALDWRVQRVDPVFCPAIDAIRPVAAPAGGLGAELGLTLADGKTTLRDGERILPRITMAGFAGTVRVDYLAHDGSLAHLYPTAADAEQHFVAMPARPLRPGERLAIGDPGSGHPEWVVGPPYGTDMIIAVASSIPLFDRAPVRNVEANGSDYLRKLQAAIEAARHKGADVTGTLMLVDTLPKK